MRALVTGASGCVGANVVEALLSRGYDVRAMHRHSSRLDALDGLNPELYKGDILDPATLIQAMEGCDIVFHVAAVSEYWRSSPDELYRVNVTGTRNVLQVASQCCIQRVVFTSSVAVFGKPLYPGEVLNESSNFTKYPMPFHYGHSKILAEVEVDRSIQNGLDVVIVNPASVLGKRDIHFIGGELIRVAKRGWFVAVPSGGMGVVSAEDVGAGHVLAAERGHTGARYILNGENISHLDLLKIIASELSTSPPLFTIPKVIGRGVARVLHLVNQLGIRFRAFDPIQIYLSTYNMYFDASKAKNDIKFTPRPANKAVKEAISWYKQHGLL